MSQLVPPPAAAFVAEPAGAKKTGDGAPVIAEAAGEAKADLRNAEFKKGADASQVHRNMEANLENGRKARRTAEMDAKRVAAGGVLDAPNAGARAPEGPAVMHIGSDIGSDISGIAADSTVADQVFRVGVQEPALPAVHPVEEITIA